MMAHSGELREDKHYAIVEGQTCIYLRAAWEVYLEHCRRTGQQEGTVNLRALKRMIKENHQRGGYVKEVDKQVKMDDRRPRTVAIDIDQASEYLDMEPFPKNKTRTFGGNRGGYGDGSGY